MIEHDSKFDTDWESQDSYIIKITIGDKDIHHIGSSIILAERGLTNVFDDYAKKVNVQDMQHGTPIVNSMINEFRNSFTGKQKGSVTVWHG